MMNTIVTSDIKPANLTSHQNKGTGFMFVLQVYEFVVVVTRLMQQEVQIVGVIWFPARVDHAC